MAGVVNRVPPGLLSLLELKAMGQNPITLGDDIVPTLDLFGNYVAAAAIVQDGNSTAAVNGVGLFQFNVAIAGPGELLVIPSAAAPTTAVLGAATTLSVRGGVYDIASAQMVLVGPRTTATVGDRPMIEFPRNMILTPGLGLGLFCESFTGVAATFRFAGLITRLKV